MTQLWIEEFASVTELQADVSLACRTMGKDIPDFSPQCDQDMLVKTELKRRRGVANATSMYLYSYAEHMAFLPVVTGVGFFPFMQSCFP